MPLIKLFKYCYPLIILGLTDIKRQFFPSELCLLVTKLNKIMTFFFEVIMCWFHLKANDEEFLPLNINNLHNSLSEDKYKNLLTEILSKWKKDPELILMTNIENQKNNLKLIYI